MFSYENLKNILFKLNPETAHNLAELGLIAAQKTPIIPKILTENFSYIDKTLEQEIWGKKFLNPLGLAAGFDKNATMIRSIASLGFGFIEVGTVTPKTQSGNKKPRLWRHIEQKSLQNAMGFNNKGVENLVKNISPLQPFILPIGVNVGKNKITEPAKALEDYKIAIKKSHAVADYLVFNLSSPNTPGLRDLQSESFVADLFAMAKEITNKPTLLKIAPDLSTKNAIDLCHKAVECKADGIVATNTTNDYELIEGSKTFGGGLSGEILRKKSRDLFKDLAKELFGKTILISVGGVMDAEEAYERILFGATLVQSLTGFIYSGPSFAKNINLQLSDLIKKDGFDHISKAVGSKII